jgi:hypothetical protein
VPARGLHQVSCLRRHAPLQGARRGQAVPAKRLHHLSSRQHAALLCAWRWQAVPAGGLPQGGCYRRHAAIVMNLQSSLHAALRRAWRRQAVPAEGLQQVCSRGDTGHCVSAWGRQALSARGLLRGSRSSSRQHALHAVSAGHTAAARRCGGAATLSTRPGNQLARTRGDPAAGGGLRINQFTAEARQWSANRLYMYASIAMPHRHLPQQLRLDRQLQRQTVS